MACRRVRILGLALLAVIVAAGRANAWGPDGHKTVATIADKLIAGTKAADQVHAILGSTSLEDAAVWADCAKGVQATGTPPVFAYKGAGTFPECAPFETPQGEAEMVDFVKRNHDTNCDKKPTEEECHRQYHYTDISVAKNDYNAKYVGARTDDVVAAISAMVAVLQGKPAPAPFVIKDQREALLLLVHYAGDIHQPLHVGAIYLDAAGHPVNPTTYDQANDTRGGNNIEVGGGKNLHTGEWDPVPADLTPGHVDATWLAAAKKIPKTTGDLAKWSTAWATDTLKQAQKAFKGLKFSAKSGTSWSTTLPSSYGAKMETIKKPQLTKAGARLAQLLSALWP
jgi:hypothetical protein